MEMNIKGYQRGTDIHGGISMIFKDITNSDIRQQFYFTGNALNQICVHNLKEHQMAITSLCHSQNF